LKKILELIANLFVIILVGIILAKLRAVAKFYYLILLGMFSICLGVGFGVMILAILGFDDVGGNIFTVLSKYSIVFGLLSFLFIYCIDKIFMFIQVNIMNFLISFKINFLHILYSFLSGASIIAYFLFIPDPIKSISFFLFFFGTLFFGLKLKVTNEVEETSNKK
jgi:hypothetical protein